MDPSRPSSSSSSISNSSILSPTEHCAVCYDISAHSRHYGVLACVGCIVFFRRSIQKKAQYICWKDGKCAVTFVSRSSCQCCRLKKCFDAGMKPEAIRKRDLLGPRDPKAMNISHNRKETSVSDIQSFPKKNKKNITFQTIQPFIRLQNFQQAHYTAYSTFHNQMRRESNDQSFAKIATSSDIELVFKLGIKNANEWASRFEPYRSLSTEEKNLVLSEYGIVFLLIDQAFKTKNIDERVWVLQNGAVLNENNMCKIGRIQFVDDLINSLSDPFKRLQLDEIECVVLKTLALLSSSFPGNVDFLMNRSETLSKILEELMIHVTQKFPETGEERFGELILLLSSIRCAVKTVYNQTKLPGIFHLKNFDPCLQSLLLT